VLAKEERSGIVERKRSLILDDQGLARLEQSAVALVNGTSDAAVYLIFGQEDDGTPVGEVTPGGKATTDETVRKYQRRLDQRLQACHPPVPVKWECVTQDGRRIWLACLFGRAPGTAVRTSTGAYPYRSGEDTHFATPEQLASWLRNRVRLLIHRTRRPWRVRRRWRWFRVRQVRATGRRFSTLRKVSILLRVPTGNTQPGR